MSGSSRLDQLGFNTQYATDEQIAVIESLSDDEIRLLVRVKERLDSVAGDVEGHVLEAGGAMW